MSIEEITKSSEIAATIKSEILQKLTPELFHHKTRKHIKTLNTSTEIIIKNDSLVYSLLSPHYVHQLEITSSDSSKNISVSYTVAGKSAPTSCTPRELEETLLYSINNYVTEIIISPATGILSAIGISKKTTIEKVIIFGLDPDKLTDAIDSAKSLRDLKKEIKEASANIVFKNNAMLEEIALAQTALEKKHSDLDEAISNKSEELSDLNNDIEEKALELKSRAEEIGRKTGEDSSLARDIETKKSHISDLESKILALNKVRSDLDTAVRALQENKNLFTDEISSYAAQGKSNISMYLLISALPIIILAIMAAKLLSNATILAQTTGIADISQAFSYLVARIPYAAISITIVIACYEVIKHIFEKIFYIHKDRLKLSSLSILAKDITDAARSDLELSDEEIYETRVKTRMDLIKWHIQGDSPRGITNETPSKKPNEPENPE